MSQESLNIKAHAQNDVIEYTHSSVVSENELLYVDGIGAIRAIDDAAESTKAAYQYKGMINVDLASSENPQQGEPVYWDVSANKAVEGESSSLTVGDFLLGVAAEDATASGGYVKVLLNEAPATLEKWWKSFTADATLTLKEKYVSVSGSSATVALTVPAAAQANAGHEYVIRCSNIDNAVTTATGYVYTFEAVGEVIHIKSNGSAWVLLSKYGNIEGSEIEDSTITVDKLSGSTTANISTGPLAVKVINSTALKALLDTSTNTLVALNDGDIVVEAVIHVKTAAGESCTVTIGTDADVDGTGADVDSLLVDADANSAGSYSSNVVTYDGDDLASGPFTAQGAGNLTITSSADESSSSFVGEARIYYIPA